MSPSSSPCLSSGNHSQRLFKKIIEDFDYKINGRALGAVSCTALVDQNGKHKHRAFLSWWQLLQAATGSLEEKVLVLLRYEISSSLGESKKF